MMLCLVAAFTPEYFSLPNDKTCEAYYRRTIEIQTAYQTFGTFALKQQWDEARPLQWYWYAAWCVTWNKDRDKRYTASYAWGPCERWRYAAAIWQLRQQQRE